MKYIRKLQHVFSQKNISSIKYLREKTASADESENKEKIIFKKSKKKINIGIYFLR